MAKTFFKKKGFFSILAIINVGIIFFFIINCKNYVNKDLLISQLFHLPSNVILVMIALNSILLVFYGYRTSILIERNNFIGFSIASVGYAANNLLPFRMGEIYRIYFSKKEYDIPVSSSTIAIGFERLNDLTVIVLLGIIMLFQKSFIIITPTYFVFILISIILLISLIGVVKKTGCFRITIFDVFLSHLKRFLIKKNLISFFISTALIWTITILVFYLFFKMTVPENHISVTDAICLMLCTTLSLSVSTLPGNLGLFEAGIVIFLNQVKHIEYNQAIALAVVFHLLCLLPQIILLLFFIVRTHEIKIPVFKKK